MMPRDIILPWNISVIGIANPIDAGTSYQFRKDMARA